MRLPVIAVVAAVTFVACERGREVGDPCRAEPDACIEGRSLWVCEEGEWSRTDCKQHCDDLGMKTDGCLVTATGDACSCIAPPVEPEMCGSEETDPPTCLGVHDIQRCIDGKRIVELCADSCAAFGFYSRGCLYDPMLEHDACYCVDVGEQCERIGYATCATDTAWTICDDGRWRVQECAEACAPMVGFACHRAPDGAECDCYDATGTTTVADSESSG